METEFLKIVQQHLECYPAMTPQDLGKLAYQSEFGPEHMVTASPELVEYLHREWAAVPADLPLRLPEPIGNGLCRFHLSGSCQWEAAVPVLVDFFCRTSKEHTGTPRGLKAKLDVMSSLNVTGWWEWRDHYEEMDCPCLRHSQQFRELYAPHYRVISESYGRELYQILVSGSCN